MGDRLRVMVADGHPLFRAGLVACLEGTDDLQVVGEAEDLETAVRMARRESPDVVVLDLSMPGDGIDGVQRIAGACPRVRIVVLSASTLANDVVGSIQAGAAGYVLKGVAVDEFLRAVRSVAAGGSPGLNCDAHGVVGRIRVGRAPGN
jgi:two-component system, NarL family, nitrate/nitrite response regulator NarL